MHGRDWPAWLRIALAIAVSWFAIDAQEPPLARPADAPAAVFSAARALAHVKAIARAHPWAQDVGVVLNLDTRGNAGPSYMFETSQGNGWLIRQYAQAVPRPLAASLSMDIYRIMPNDTDLTIYKQAGMAGLNFAVTGGVA